MPPFYAAHNLPEDERITLIGATVVEFGKTVGFIVDVENGSHEKGDRYIKKLLERFPSISVFFRGDGPIPGAELIKVGLIQ